MFDITNLAEQSGQVEIRDDLGGLGLEQVGTMKQLRAGGWVEPGMPCDRSWPSHDSCD